MSQQIQKIAAISETLPEMPIEPAWIQEGTPTARGQIVVQSEDKKISSGLWSCEPGKFRWEFVWDEFVQILSGEVDITDELGKSITLKAGDMAHFPCGAKTSWHVKDAVRKYFVIRTAEPLEG